MKTNISIKITKEEPANRDYMCYADNGVSLTIISGLFRKYKRN